MNSKEHISKEKYTANLCLTCTRESCDYGQHIGCAFVKEIGKDKSGPILRQEYCGFLDIEDESCKNRIYKERYRNKNK